MGGISDDLAVGLGPGPDSHSVIFIWDHHVLRRLSLWLVPTCAAWLGCGEAVPPTGQVDPPDVTVEDPREGTAVISGEEFLPGCGSAAWAARTPSTRSSPRGALSLASVPLLLGERPAPV